MISFIRRSKKTNLRETNYRMVVTGAGGRGNWGDIIEGYK